MFNDFFQVETLPTDQLFGIYDPRLVILSYLVAVFASYVALDLTARLRDRNNTSTSTLLWLMGGSIAMGAGIWSMHFIGMLSFTIPGLGLKYDIFWTIFSLIVAILASGFALSLLKTSLLNIVHLIAGGIILGLAIASMHYTGMEGMLITLNIRYLPGLFFLSILVAIIASEAAIWLALKSNTVILRLRNRVKVGSAIIMGLAICGMHYTAMASSVFTPLCYPILGTSASSLDPTILAMTIAGVTMIILGVAFVASSHKEAVNLEQFEKARQLGIAEISASVLHNVGNVLNSVNVTTELLAEKISASRLTGLDKLSDLLNSHQHDLATFMTQDPHGKKTLLYLNSLKDVWHEEKNEMTHEIKSLKKNVRLIADIISTQQNLSKETGFEQVVAVNELLEEALLITGLETKNNIEVAKHFHHVSPILTDKVKLLQVFINLLRNAKEALMASTKPDKLLVLTIEPVNKEKILIQFSENGIGILSSHLNKIFNYGFTTKDSGHGFGLHVSALAVNELGGSIEVKSEGIEKGATFSIVLPYKIQS